MIKLLKDFRSDIQRLCATHHVKYLAVFGSAAGEGFTPQSDVDLLVEFQEGMTARQYASAYFGLKSELEAMLGRPVDLVTAKSLTNPYFRDSVMSEQQALYAA